MNYTIIAPLFAVLLAGCSHEHPDKKADQGGAVTKTVWTEKTELFMEYDNPRPGEKTVFLIHLTDLGNFKPVEEGPLVLTFTPEAGEPVTVSIEKPQKPGIFRTEVSFPQQGAYVLKAALSGKGLSDAVVMPGIEVAGPEEKRDKEHREEKSGSAIAFLKEQQWSIDFMVGLPEKRAVSSAVTAAGELIPASNADATISAPLSGIVSLSHKLPHMGKRVLREEVLAVIEPPLNQQGGMGQFTASHAEAKNRLILAQKEHDRAKLLYEAKAVPKRRLDEAELGLESAQTAFKPLDRAMGEMKDGAPENRILVKSPVSGTVVELMTSNGKAVEAGQPLFRIINTASLWLKANIPATEIGRLENPLKATFTIPGIAGELRPRRFVTINDVVDARTRTVPAIFEVSNAGGRLKIGMFADVSIKTGSAKNALTVPEDALFEDEGRHFVFIQSGGESFERREVSVGIRESGHAQITGGIGGAERVVIKGGYYVKLASLSARQSQGDSHAGHGH